MVARGWEFVFDDKRERALKVKDRAAFLHHLLYGFATLGFIFFGEFEFFGIWVWGVEIERDRSNVLGVTSLLTDITDAILVDLVDGHVETNVVGSGLGDVLEDGVVGIASDDVMVDLIAIQT